MNASETAFLRAIHDDPTDATHKLVFADWLDDHDDHDRAAFLRDLVAWQRGEDEDERAEQEGLLNRRLHEGPLQPWVEPLRPLGQVGVDRDGLLAVWLAGDLAGLPASLGSAAGWVTYLDIGLAGGLRALPLLRPLLPLPPRAFLEVDLHEPAVLDGLDDLRGADWIASLQVDCDAPQVAGLHRLLDRLVSPRLGEFRLNLDGAGDATFAFLAGTPWAGLLTDLSAPESEVGDSGVAALAAARLERLRTLDLRETRVGDAGLEALLAAPNLPRLGWLDVSRARFGRRGLRALLARPELLYHPLEYSGLDLPTLADVLAAGRRQICGGACCLNCPAPAGRFWLDGPGHALHLSVADAEALRRLGHAPAGLVVEQLWLHTSGCDADLVAALAAQVPNLDRVRTLGLIGTDLDLDDADRLAEVFPAVERLGLVFGEVATLAAVAVSRLGERLSAVGLRRPQGRSLRDYLSRLPPGCRSLSLREDRMSDEDVARLAGSPRLGGLEELDLRGTEIDDPGAGVLAASPHLGRLRRLVLSRRSYPMAPVDPRGPEADALRARIAEVVFA